MTDTYRALCAELLRAWQFGDDIAGPMNRARAALAQPYSDPTEEQRLGYLKGLEDCAHAALAQPEPALSPAVDRMLDLQDRIQMGSLTLAEALDEIAGPKPPSLKEQALKALTAIHSTFHVYELDANIIRRALEALDD